MLSVSAGNIALSDYSQTLTLSRTPTSSQILAFKSELTLYCPLTRRRILACVRTMTAGTAMTKAARKY